MRDDRIPTTATVLRLRFGLLVVLRCIAVVLLVVGATWFLVSLLDGLAAFVVGTVIGDAWRIVTNAVVLESAGWLVSLAAGTALVLAERRLTAWVVPMPRAGCPDCGYPVASSMAKCPECGLELGPARSAPPGIQARTPSR